MANSPSPPRQPQQPVAPFRCVPANKFGWYGVDVFGHCINNAPDRTSVLLNKLKEICAENRVNLQTFYVEEITEIDLFGGSNPIFTFYVNDYEVAKELQVIQLPADCRMQLSVTNKVPKVRVNKNFREKLKTAMLNHYSPHTRELDLQAFHADPQFKEDFCCLAQNHCLSAAIQVMENVVPKVTRLVLDHNNLSDLSPFHGIENILPDIMHISVANNDLKDLNTFRVFQHLSLTQMDICKNPVDTPTKRRELAEMLPGVLMMDGERVHGCRSPLWNPYNDPVASRFLEQSKIPQWSRNNSSNSLVTSTPKAKIRPKRSPMNSPVAHESNLEEKLISKPKNIPKSKAIVVVNHNPEWLSATEDANDLDMEKSSKPKPKLSLETIVEEISISQLKPLDKSDDSNVEQLPEYITAKEELEESNEENTPRKINMTPDMEFVSDLEVTPEQVKKNSREVSKIELDELTKHKPKLEVTPRLVYDPAATTGWDLETQASDLEKTPKQKGNRKAGKELVPDLELTPKPASKDLEKTPTRKDSQKKGKEIVLGLDATPKAVKKNLSKSELEYLESEAELEKFEGQKPNLDATPKKRSPELIYKEQQQESHLQRTPRREEVPKPELVLDQEMKPTSVRKVLQKNLEADDRKPQLGLTPKNVQEFEVERDLQPANQSNFAQKYIEPIKELSPETYLEIDGNIMKKTKLSQLSQESKESDLENTPEWEGSSSVTPEATDYNPDLPSYYEHDAEVEVILQSNREQGSRASHVEDLSWLLQEISCENIKLEIEQELASNNLQDSEVERVLQDTMEPDDVPTLDQENEPSRVDCLKPTWAVERHNEEGEEEIDIEEEEEGEEEADEEEEDEVEYEAEYEAGEADKEEEKYDNKEVLLTKLDDMPTTDQENETLVWLPRDLPSQISELPTKSEQKDAKKDKPSTDPLECEAAELDLGEECRRALELIDQVPQWKPLPKTSSTSSMTEAGYKDLQRFVNAYINAYDNHECRAGLASFYKDSALITFAATEEAYSACLYPRLDQFHRDVPRYSQDFKTHTRCSAMEYFVNAPPTKHLKYSMIIDLLVMKPHSISFTMSGYYCEVHRSTGAPTAYVYFMRTFVLNRLSIFSEPPDFRIGCEISYAIYANYDRIWSGVIPDIGDKSYFMCKIFYPLVPRYNSIYGGKKH